MTEQCIFSCFVDPETVDNVVAILVGARTRPSSCSGGTLGVVRREAGDHSPGPNDNE